MGSKLTASSLSLKAMKEGMLQVQLLVPSVDIDATLTANMRRGQQLELELKSEVKVMEIASSQQIKLDYGKVVFANIENVHLGQEDAFNTGHSLTITRSHSFG